MISPGSHSSELPFLSKPLLVLDSVVVSSVGNKLIVGLESRHNFVKQKFSVSWGLHPRVLRVLTKTASLWLSWAFLLLTTLHTMKGVFLCLCLAESNRLYVNCMFLRHSFTGYVTFTYRLRTRCFRH